MYTKLYNILYYIIMKKLSSKWLLLAIASISLYACTTEKEYPSEESSNKADSSFVHQFTNEPNAPGTSTTLPEEPSIIDKLQDGGTENIVAK